MKLVTIEQWSAHDNPDPYIPPECRGNPFLVGIVSGHPQKPDGARIQTSSIKTARGRRVTTRSGTTYMLGEADPEYVAWLTEQGRSFDPDHPFRKARKKKAVRA